MSDTLINPVPSDFELVKYGVAVTAISEDHDFVILGHHPVRRVLAAVNAYCREIANDTCTAANLGDFTESIEQRWAHFYEGTQDDDYAWRFEYCDKQDDYAFAITRWRP